VVSDSFGKLLPHAETMRQKLVNRTERGIFMNFLTPLFFV
jgi:hypothetical protein